MNKLHGIIPLEGARIQNEPPAGFLQSNAQQHTNLCITITLNVQHSYIAKHPFYVLMCPTTEACAAWMTALNQASIPRSTLLSKLYETGDLQEVVEGHEHDIKVSFPTTGAAVISSSGCVRLDSPNGSPRREGHSPRELQTTTAIRVAETPVVVTVTPPAVKTTPVTRPVTEISASAVFGQAPPSRTSLTHGTTKAAAGTLNDTRKSVTRASAPHVVAEIEPESLRSTFGNVTNSPEVPAAA